MVSSPRPNHDERHARVPDERRRTRWCFCRVFMTSLTSTPPGTTHLDGDGTNEFTLPHPVVDDTAAAAFPENVSVTGSAVSITAFVGSSVTDAVEEEVADLTAQCVEEKMVAIVPAGDTGVRKHIRRPVHSRVVRGSESDRCDGHRRCGRCSMGFSVVVDGNRLPMQAVYEGTRDAERRRSRRVHDDELRAGRAPSRTSDHELLHGSSCPHTACTAVIRRRSHEQLTTRPICTNH